MQEGENQAGYRYRTSKRGKELQQKNKYRLFVFIVRYSFSIYGRFAEAFLDHQPSSSQNVVGYIK